MAVKKTTRTPTSRRQKIDFMKATNNIGKPIAAVAGFAVGKYALKKLTKSETVSGLMGMEMKDYLIPAAVTMGGLVGTQLTKNEYIKLGLVGAAGAGVEAVVKKATGKTILQGLEGLIGDDSYGDDDMELRALNPVTQQLPAADIDIEREIQRSVSGVSDFSMSDEPIGSAVNDFSMSDEPVGATNYDDDLEAVGKIRNVDSDSMDYDIFSGDMMES